MSFILKRTTARVIARMGATRNMYANLAATEVNDAKAFAAGLKNSGFKTYVRTYPAPDPHMMVKATIPEKDLKMAAVDTERGEQVVGADVVNVIQGQGYRTQSLPRDMTWIRGERPKLFFNPGQRIELTIYAYRDSGMVVIYAFFREGDGWHEGEAQNLPHPFDDPQWSGAKPAGQTMVEKFTQGFSDTMRKATGQDVAPAGGTATPAAGTDRTAEVLAKAKALGNRPYTGPAFTLSSVLEGKNTKFTARVTGRLSPIQVVDLIGGTLVALGSMRALDLAVASKGSVITITWSVSGVK